MGSDVARYFQLSAQGGHAGPASTSAYVHQIESALAARARAACPWAWSQAQARKSEAQQGFRFEHVADGLVTERPTLTPTPVPAVPTAEASRAVALDKRTQITWRVAQNFALDSVAGQCMVSEPLVHTVVSEQVQAMALASLVKHDALATLRKQCRALSAWQLWARAARQPKYGPIVGALTDAEAAGRWSPLRLLWQDWLLCRDGDDLALTNQRPATRLVKFLLDAGVAKQCLQVAVAKGAPAMAPDIEALGFVVRGVAHRKGREPFRLFLADHAEGANFASVSMKGFHWLMLLVGATLIARGES